MYRRPELRESGFLRMMYWQVLLCTCCSIMFQRIWTSIYNANLKKRRRNKTTLLESFTMLGCSWGVLGVATAGKTSLPSSHWHTAQQPIYESTWLISLRVTDLGTPSPLAVKLYWLVCFSPHKLLSGMGGLGTEQPWLWQQQESTF